MSAALAKLRANSRSILVGALALAAFAVRLQRLLESAEPPGTDGYYYVVQVQSLLGRGHLHAPDGSWVLPLMAAFAIALRDPILAVKVASCALAALVVVASARATTRPAVSLALVTWAAASPVLTHLAGDFPKMLGIVAPLLGVLAIGMQPVRSRRIGIVLGLLALLAATAHRLGAGILVLGFLGGALGRRFSRESPSSRARWILAGAIAVAFVVLTALLPNLLRAVDLERLSGQLTLSPHWPPAPWSYFALRSTSGLEELELLGAALAIPLGIWRWLRRTDERAFLGALLLPLCICVAPFWRPDVLDAGYRFALLAPLLAAPIWASALPDLDLRVAPLALALTLVGRSGFDPQSHPPYAMYREVIARIPRPLPELLIAHVGLNFLYDHQTQHDAMAWAPEPALDRTHVGRVAWGIRIGEWLEYAPQLDGVPRPLSLGHDYFFVREDLWEAFVQNAGRDGSDDLEARLHDWRNPLAVRPESLLRNHR